MSKTLCQLTLNGIRLFTISLIFWNGLRTFPGDRWLLVRLGNFFAPWLLMALLPVLAVAMLSRQLWLSRLALLLILLISSRYLTQLVPQTNAAQATDNRGQLTVMTFNVNYRNQDTAAIAHLIRSERPDIIALQEVTEPVILALAETLAAEYPYALIDEGVETLQGVLSRYPLQYQPPPSSDYQGRILRASIETPAGPVSLWNIHPKVALKQTGWHLQRTTLTAVAKEVASATGPVIVLGDFNTTDQTETYRLLANHLTDAHRVAGRGLGFSFPARTKIPDSWRYIAGLPTFGPLVRIDLVLVSPHFIPQSSRVVPRSAGSDHLPLIVTLGLAKPQEVSLMQ